MKTKIDLKASRIGTLPIKIPTNVHVSIDDNTFTARGLKGTNTKCFDPEFKIIIEGEEIKVSRVSFNRRNHLHATTRSVLNNLITGVTDGFEKKLCLVGVGYKAKVESRKLILSVGFTHDVIVELPDGLDATVKQNTQITLTGIDISEVGCFAAKVRGINPPERYGGKGIRYAEEELILKEGKRGKK